MEALSYRETDITNTTREKQARINKKIKSLKFDESDMVPGTN